MKGNYEIGRLMCGGALDSVNGKLVQHLDQQDTPVDCVTQAKQLNTESRAYHAALLLGDIVKYVTRATAGKIRGGSARTQHVYCSTHNVTRSLFLLEG